MTRRWAGALVALAAVVLAAAIYLFLRGDGRRTGATEAREPGEAAGGSVDTAPAAEPAEPAESFTARLFYPASNDRLMAEERALASGESPPARARAVLAALLGTAPAAPRLPPFPIALEVGRVLLLEDGTLVADLRSAEAADPPASGSTVELLRVYSVVHTLLRNVPEAKQVVLLWNGRQRASFAGHVDTARALRARPELESAPPAVAPEAAAATEAR